MLNVKDRDFYKELQKQLREDADWPTAVVWG